MQHIYQNDDRNFEYLEARNDPGIHFLYDWNKDDEITIKRNENNFPIISYSLFDSENFIPNKTIITKIDNKDLSKLKDKELIKLTYLTGKINFELENGKIIGITSKPYKFNNFKSKFDFL